MFKTYLFCMLFLNWFLINSQKTTGIFISTVHAFHFKMENGIALGITHSRSYKDNNKWQNILQVGYFPGSYSYHIKPRNSNISYYRKVHAHNFLVRIGEDYVALLLNKRTKKWYFGPSLTLNVLGFYETGESINLKNNEIDDNHSDFELELGISPLLFTEYEYTPNKNSFFIRMEGGYIFNPINELAPYNGFPGAWFLSLSAGYRINNF